MVCKVNLVCYNRINQLEKITSMTLFARTTRDINLTNEGKEFLEHCRSIMDRVENLDAFLNKKKGINGVLRIVLPPYFSRHHIVPYIEEFMEMHSSLKLDIMLTEDPVNIIEESFDLQVRIQIPEEENLRVAKLMENRKIVCASVDYIKKHGAPKTPHDLLSHNCIEFGENSVWKLKNKLTKKITELKEINGKIKCNNGEIIKELVLSGRSITLKSVSDVEKEVKEKN